MVKISVVHARVGDLQFDIRLEEEAAPGTVAAFRGLLPFKGKIVQSAWAGEAALIPLEAGSFKIAIEGHEFFENHTHYPAPGSLVINPGGFAPYAIFLAYGSATYSDRMGPLGGNHFATIEGGREKLAELGHRLLWKGAQDISFEE